MPLIRPLLGPDDALSGMDFRLIIRTSDRNLKEVERILTQVDVARQRLRITVEQASVEDRATTSQSVTGEARIGDKARVTLPAKPPQKGGLVVQKDGLRYTANRRTTAASNTNTQTVITLDGQRAYIRIGQSVPHVKKILALSRRQLVLIQDIELQDVTTGFDVLPRMRGDRVLVEITPRLSSLRNPATGLADFQELSTTVETKLGEWLDLGEILGNRGEVERAILESASTTSDERRAVRLKIE
jgi:type II secretory pathway component GspD/PulD (secretin)